MRVALCVSGDFRPASNIIAAAGAMILPEEQVDIFAALWTPPETSENQLRTWIRGQMNARMTLKRWAFEPRRQMTNWDKFVANSSVETKNYTQQLERLEHMLQMVGQLKADQERLDGTDYDAVVRLECHIHLQHAPRLSKFATVLDDHVVIGQLDVMPWWPTYDFRIALMSSRNMGTYSALHSLHRRQYLLRFKAMDVGQGLVNHFHHTRLKTLCVPVAYTGC